MQDIYDSEINFRIETFWDGGFDVSLGDYLNGFVAETNVDTWADTVEFLKVELCKHWPHSEFAKKYGSD